MKKSCLFIESHKCFEQQRHAHTPRPIGRPNTQALKLEHVCTAPTRGAVQSSSARRTQSARTHLHTTPKGGGNTQAQESTCVHRANIRRGSKAVVCVAHKARVRTTFLHTLGVPSSEECSSILLRRIERRCPQRGSIHTTFPNTHAQA